MRISCDLPLKQTANPAWLLLKLWKWRSGTRIRFLTLLSFGGGLQCSGSADVLHTKGLQFIFGVSRWCWERLLTETLKSCCQPV